MCATILTHIRASNLRRLKATDTDIHCHQSPFLKAPLQPENAEMGFSEHLHQLSFSIFPGRCILCRRPSQRALDICLACEQDLPWQTEQCPQCAEPGTHAHLCDRCHSEPPGFTCVFCPLKYAYPVDQLILDFKEHRNIAAGNVLSRVAMMRLIKSTFAAVPAGTIITPVPIHTAKLKQRGFNQAALIADLLHHRLPATTRSALLEQRDQTPDQKRLPANRREQNISGRYSTNADLAGETVLLVDDVVTTTNTIREASRMLVKAGAREVIVFAIARTPSAAAKRVC